MVDNTELKKKFLTYYRQLPVLKLAAASVGRTDDTILEWKKTDSEFSEQVANARSAWALENAGKVKSREWLLERVMKDHFAQRSELTGKDGEALIPTPILGGKSMDALPSNNSDE